jgi:hypothetical protein
MGFDDEAYLDANPDVRDAVRHGLFQSGHQHFVVHGAKENRMHWPSTGRRTVLFCTSHNRNFFYRLGDLCLAHPTFNAIKEKFAGDNVYWITRPELAPLTAPASSETDKSCDCYVIDAAAPNRFAHDWLYSNRHPIDFVADISRISIELRHRYIDIHVPIDAERAVAALSLPEPFVAIAAGPCHTSRNWPYSDRQSVANHFAHQGIACVSIGGQDSAALEGTLDLCAKLSLIEAVALIRRARLYIGPDTGTSWLACAARTTPKVCVLNESRLRDGIVGFQGFLSDRNIRDVVAQDGSDHCFEVAWEMWNAPDEGIQ